ncbi:MAG: hypothetical protein IK114_12485 [Fibrobacter sp.]|nr:hypothetical protein [Fibrobacter sp.]
MFKRIVFSSFLTLATALSFADVAGGEQPAPQVESSSSVALSSSAEVVSSSSEEPEGPKHREVPVRYWVNGDSVELDAIFVKIENDTVYLKKPTEAELRHIEHLTDKKAIALQESNGQEVEQVEDENEEVDLTKPAEIIMTDAVKDSMAAQSDTTKAEAAPVDDGSDDDLETALQKEDKRVKMEEIAKMEQEIREREIQDSIAAAKKNPYIKIYRFALKRLYNLEDEVMIDLSLSNYFVPEKKVVEETIELYPPGKANLLVVSEPEACSLYVNGIPLKQVAPDTIRNIKPGKYTISVMKVLKDVEWWGSAVVRINADSLNKVTIPVLRPSTRLTLNSNPEAAEVYVGEAPSLNKMPHYMTDMIVDNVKPQVKTTVYFRKVGYRDTSVTTEIKPYMPNLVYVDMTPVLDDLEFIEEQNAFNKERSQRRIGRGLLWGSIVPIIAGGVMWYLAERDWSKAADKKHAYERLSAFDSDDTRQMVKDNHELNDSGDTKCGVAIGLGALGLGLLTAGIILAF